MSTVTLLSYRTVADDLLTNGSQLSLTTHGQNENNSALNRHITAINPTSQLCCTLQQPAPSNAHLVLNNGAEINRSPIIEILESAKPYVKDQRPYKKLNALIEKLKTNETLYIDDKEKLARDLYEIRRLLPAHKNNEIAVAIRQLEKFLFSCALSVKMNEFRKHYQRGIASFSNPGYSQTRSLNVGGEVSFGCTLAENIASAKVFAKLNYSRTSSSDTDDEGIVSSGKENQYKITGGADVNVGIDTEIGIQAGASLAGKKSKYKGISYNGGAPDFFREKFTHKLFDYKKQHGVSSIFKRRHSMLYHQQLAQNNQPILQECLSTLTGKSVESTSPIPFQPDVNKLCINGKAYTGNANASALFSEIASAGASVQYDYNKNDLKINLSENMYSHVISENENERHMEELNALFNQYSKAFSIVFANKTLWNGNNLKENLSLQEIKESVDILDNKLKEYSSCVQKYLAGISREGKEKHAIEHAWGVEKFGRYGFLQAAEVILATLASRLKKDFNNEESCNQIKDQMSQINSRIINPVFSCDKKKLTPLLSFTNLLKIHNHSHIFTAELDASLGGDTVSGGGSISLAVVKKRVNNPYRIRAGEHRDIEITLSGNVTLANLLRKITATIASEVGATVDELQSAVSDIFDSSIDASKGVKIIIRYFSPDWSNKNQDNRHYSHQVTYMQLLTNTEYNRNLLFPATPVGGGVNIGASVSRTDVALQRMGTDTLNYLMLRYNYLCERKEEQDVWQKLIKDNRGKILTLMQNILKPGTNSSKEIFMIYNEKLAKTPATEQEELWETYQQIRKDIMAVKYNEQNEAVFEKAMQGVTTIMDWHRETTDSLFYESLTPISIVRPQKNKLQTLLLH